MKVLALVTEAYGRGGGIAQATRDVINALADIDRIGSIQVFPRRAPDESERLTRKIYQSCTKGGRPGYAARAVFEAATNPPDLIFCNHAFMAPLSAVIARLVDAKLMVQLHGIEIWSEPGLVQRRSLESADLLLCVSRDTRARALEHLDIDYENAVVCNNTVASEFMPSDRFAAKQKFGVSGAFTLLTVSRLDSRERYKGHDRVFSALQTLAAKSPRDIAYLVAGDGNDRTRLEALASTMGVSDRVRFLGNVPTMDLPDLYRAADLFVLPSSGEGFGIVFLEAMACGTPALGLAIGGARDALGDGRLGWCVDAGDFQSSLHQAVAATPPNAAELSAAVQLRFGKKMFDARLARIVDALFPATRQAGGEPGQRHESKNGF